MRVEGQMINIITAVHEKVANDLVDQYDTILLPKFSTKEMAKRKDGSGTYTCKIGKMSARPLLHWSHYQFRQHLLHKAKKWGKEVIICTEEFTTKSCRKCFKLNYGITSEKVFECIQG